MLKALQFLFSLSPSRCFFRTARPKFVADKYYLLPKVRAAKIGLVSLGDNEKYFVGNLFVIT